jgi:hypothetical protein
VKGKERLRQELTSYFEEVVGLPFEVENIAVGDGKIAPLASGVLILVFPSPLERSIEGLNMKRFRMHRQAGRPSIVRCTSSPRSVQNWIRLEYSYNLLQVEYTVNSFSVDYLSSLLSGRRAMSIQCV